MLANGATSVFEAGASAWSRFFAAQVTPRASVFMPQGAGPAGAATFGKAYGRFVAGFVSFEVGRNNFSLGHGLSGGALVSQNARPRWRVRHSNSFTL